MVKTAARTITLSAETELVASAVTKGTGFDLRSLKPGMLVDTIVDSVLSNGILVSAAAMINCSPAGDVWTKVAIRR